MAEFVEVMRQVQRICERKNCMRCPLHKHSAATGMSTCMMIERFCDKPEVKYAELESAIMQWAKENPEPVYPSWKEWHDKTFPNARTSVNPCWFITGNPAECNRMECVKCRNRPIPAEIAKKLGIQPKEANEWYLE